MSYIPGQFEDLLVNRRCVANALYNHEARLDEIVAFLKVVRVAHTKGFKLVKDKDVEVVRSEGS